MEPTFFATPGEWRKWLVEHHDRRQELLVGFYKKDSGKPSITWPESVDHALCFGWIDGVRRRIDDQSYCIRFTPRKTSSVWSAVNIERIKELTAAGLMSPAGVRAFEGRKENRSRIYSFEQANIEFGPEQERQFRRNAPAWKFFQAQAPWYRRAATWWVVSAKREETKAKRLTALMADSEHGRAVVHLTRHDASMR
jgi:uncharacterized protein YdeI (YjbR/CyaY-like superfamily)